MLSSTRILQKLLFILTTISFVAAATGQCMDPEQDPCHCEGCTDSMGSAGCISANGGCCYYYSTGYLNPKTGDPGNQNWQCTAYHPSSKGIPVNAGGSKLQDTTTKLFFYNPLRLCMTGSGENHGDVVSVPLICEEGAQSPCDICELDSLTRTTDVSARSTYVPFPLTLDYVKLAGECKVCREGYTLHPLTKGCCPNDGTWDLGEDDNTCSSVHRSRGMGMPADGGYCECRGCAPAPAGKGSNGCGTTAGGCCWYSEDNAGTCTDTVLPGMTKPQKVCNILPPKNSEKPISSWECIAGVNEPCASCGGYIFEADINGTKQGNALPVEKHRRCTKCNVGYELIKEIGSCCKTDAWGVLHLLVMMFICIGVVGLGYVGWLKMSSNGSGSNGSYSERGLAGRAGDFGI